MNWDEEQLIEIELLFERLVRNDDESARVELREMGLDDWRIDIGVEAGQKELAS